MKEIVMAVKYSSKMIPAVAGLIVSLYFIASCTNPVLDSSAGQTGLDAPGALILRIEPSSTDRSVVPSDWEDTISAYEIFLSGDQAMGPVVITEPEIFLENLPLGLYTISANAMNSDQYTIAVGSIADFLVSGEPDQEVFIELLPVMGGDGSLTVGYSWNNAGFSDGSISHAIATLTPVGGTPYNVNVEIRDNGILYETELPSGAYIFSCDLYSGGRMVSSTVEEIRVFDGQDTRTVLEFDLADFESEPETPGNAEPEQQGLTVGLNWVDTSDRESGFRIYRSTDGVEFELIGDGIPANSTSWTDEPVIAGTAYVYRVVAVNDFGESAPVEISINVEALIVTMDEFPLLNETVILGESENIISTYQLLQGFINNYNISGLRIVSVSLSGGGTVRLSGDKVIVDTSEIPFESEGGEISLEYTVHIEGEPMNEQFMAEGTVLLTLAAPEVEEISEEDLKEPVRAYVYDNHEDLERKSRTYDPPDPPEIFESWGRIVGADYFTNGAEAESLSVKREDNADMASWWKLKQDNEGFYIEYAKNSIYTGFVSPDGEESDRFTLEATVSSKDDDDDVVGLIVAYVQEDGVNYILEAARSQGAESGNRNLEPSRGWGLLVRRLSPDGDELGEVIWSRQLDVDGTSPAGWKGRSSRLRIERNGDRVSISASAWDDTDTYAPESAINVNLSANSELRRFSGALKYGYFVASQERSSFRDIVIDGGIVTDRLFYLNPDTGESEVWWYDTGAQRWLRINGATIQDVLGYPLEISNPETGDTWLVERKGFRHGGWLEWWNRWRSWSRWDRGRHRQDD